MDNIGGAWFVGDVQPKDLVREAGGRRVQVDTALEYWHFHAPDCVVYQTARERHQVRAVCGDRTPVPVGTSSVVQWSFAADGLRRTGPSYLANGRAVEKVEFIPMPAIIDLAMGQSPPPLHPVEEVRPIDPAVHRPDGNTPLIDAVVRARLDLVDALLAAGADPNGRSTTNQSTALMAASGIGASLPIVERLLAARADPNLQDQNGETALMRAAGVGQTAVVRVLLAAGADRTLRDAAGRTALDRVAANPDPSIRALLQF